MSVAAYFLGRMANFVQTTPTPRWSHHFGSSLNAHLHFHCVVIDGVFDAPATGGIILTAATVVDGSVRIEAADRAGRRPATRAPAGPVTSGVRRHMEETGPRYTRQSHSRYGPRVHCVGPWAVQGRTTPIS